MSKDIQYEIREDNWTGDKTSERMIFRDENISSKFDNRGSVTT